MEIFRSVGIQSEVEQAAALEFVQNGAIVAVEAPKSRVSITQQFISTQAPSQTVLDTINLLPGVNFTNNDAFGSAGGDVTLRGFDSQRISLLQDGIPLNDSGNWYLIHRLNPTLSRDPKLPIPAGTVLRLPAGAKTD